MTSVNSKVIVALDYNNSEAAMELAGRLDPQQCRLKVGKELFTVAGPSLVQELVKLGFDVFLDLKFHDNEALSYELNAMIHQDWNMQTAHVNRVVENSRFVDRFAR